MGLRVKRTAPFCMGFKGVMVKPGLNSFSDAESKVLESDPAFQEQCDLNNQSVVGEAKGDESLAESIIAMNVKKATKALKDVLDLDVLKAVQEREVRPSVLNVVEKQLAMLRDEGDSK